MKIQSSYDCFFSFLDFTDYKLSALVEKDLSDSINVKYMRPYGICHKPIVLKLTVSLKLVLKTKGITLPFQ